MKNCSLINKALLVLSTGLFSQLAWSHGGHDHSAANASLIHLLWLAPVIIAAGVAYYRINKNKSQDKS